MPKLKINKQLNRPDGQKIPAGSIAESNPIFVESEKAIKFPTKLMFNQDSIDNKKTPIPCIVEFKFNRLVKQCTDDEWTKVNDDANAGLLVSQFYQECIDDMGMKGSTEIIV